MLTKDNIRSLMFPQSHRQMDVDWRDMPRFLEREYEVGFEFCPDYQRGRVWTREQQIAYTEHVIFGGETAREVILVNVGKHLEDYIPNKNKNIILLRNYSLLDGLQRVTCALSFMKDEFSVLHSLRPDGYKWSELDGSIRHNMQFKVRRVVVPTLDEVFKLYLRLNTAGTPHTPEELDRVRQMIQNSNPM